MAADNVAGIVGNVLGRLEGAISVALVGSSTWRISNPLDLDYVVILDKTVTFELMKRVWRTVRSSCKGCRVYVANSTYCHSMLPRPSIYIMLYSVEEYSSKVSRLLRHSWGLYNKCLQGRPLTDFGVPSVTRDDLLSDPYGIGYCVRNLEKGVYESKPIILSSHGEPGKVRVVLKGAHRLRYLRYCVKWSLYNYLSHRGIEVNPFDWKALAETASKLLGLSLRGWLEAHSEGELEDVLYKLYRVVST